MRARSIVVLAAAASALAGVPTPAEAQIPIGTGTVTVVNTGEGHGTVEFMDQAFLVQGKQCFQLRAMNPGETCTLRFLVAPFLWLGMKAYPSPGSHLTGWSAPCEWPPDGYPPYGPISDLGTAGPNSFYSAECDIYLDALGNGLDRRIEVNFEPNMGGISVRHDGDGAGEVNSSPTGISCGRDGPTGCLAYFPADTVVTLTAKPHDDGSQFEGWSGRCSGTGRCAIPIDGTPQVAGATIYNATVEVQARFTRPDPPTRDRPRLTRTLFLARYGTGRGIVRSVGSSGISCGADCSAAVLAGDTVVLRATPRAGSRFAGWGPECANRTSPTCRIVMDTGRRVSATFTPRTRELVVTKELGGAVTSAPAGVSCVAQAAATCRATFDHGTQVALTPAPAAGYQFAGWEGACTGAGACVLLMDAPKAVTARFARVYRLQVRREGTGAGTIVIGTGSTDIIQCDLGCLRFLPPGAHQAVAVLAREGSTFAGFSGACSGTDSCFLTMDADKEVVVRFDAPPNMATLTVGLSDPGRGRVTSDVAGIDCLPDCVQPFALDTLVTLTAHPADGFTFSRFAGPCAQTVGASCTVRLSESRQVLAAFSRVPPPLAAPPGAGAPQPTDAEQPPVGDEEPSSQAPAGIDAAVDARITSVRVRRAGRRRTVRVTLVTSEHLTGAARLTRGGRTLASRRFDVAAGRRAITLRVRRAARAGRARLQVTARDGAGNVRTLRRTVRVRG